MLQSGSLTVCDHMTVSLKRRSTWTGYLLKHVSSINCVCWYTTLSLAEHRHISWTFFNPSPFHLAIQFCGRQPPTAYTCLVPDCCSVSEPSESPLPRCGTNCCTSSARLTTLTLSRRNWKLFCLQSFMILTLFTYISFHMLTCLYVRTGQLSAV